MVDKARVNTDIKEFLRGYIGDKELQDDTPIFSAGLLNSLFAMQLVLFIEKNYQFKIENQDLDMKNFNSLAAISDFVVNKSAM